MNERRETPGLEGIEERIGELERIADTLDSVPEDEVVEVLDRAVSLLGEINAGMEAALRSAGEEERRIEDILDRVDLGPFDRMMVELEGREENSGEGRA